MARNRIRDQYKNISALLRRIEHVDNDYDVFVIVEESVEAARYKAAFNARKFFAVTETTVVSWEDWLDKDKTKCVVLGYTNKVPQIYYKGYLDYAKQPLSNIERNLREKDAGEEE
ncbi:MAG: hypothetical protein M0Z55_00100 [Peptococcaceae bacterium]|nr:hypothetical protein [Peptococcaceae bacterium]